MTSSHISRRNLVAGGIAALGLAAPGPLWAACPSRSDQIDSMWPELFFDLPLDQPKSARHPLTGRVWSRTRPWADNALDECGFDLNARDMQAAIAHADIACLGEVHDNPAHHLFRARLIGNKPAGAVFEQLTDDQQAGLDRFRELSGTSADLIRLIDWDKSPWAKMADYQPLFDAVVRARLPIYAGDVTRDTIRKAAKDGLAAVLSLDELARLALDKPLGDAADAASRAEIEGSHCGMLPKEAVPRLATAQRLRDAHLADAVLRAVKDQGAAVLFAGNGHVRSDRGVPWYIRARMPDKTLVCVMLIEVEDGKTDPEAYVQMSPEGKPAADFVVFTPEAKRSDPCESMKAAKPK